MACFLACFNTNLWHAQTINFQYTPPRNVQSEAKSTVVKPSYFPLWRGCPLWESELRGCSFLTSSMHEYTVIHYVRMYVYLQVNLRRTYCNLTSYTRDILLHLTNYLERDHTHSDVAVPLYRTLQEELLALPKSGTYIWVCTYVCALISCHRWCAFGCYCVQCGGVL